jgi:predicted dehydrogenase
MEDDAGSSFKALVVGTGFGCRIQVPALRLSAYTQLCKHLSAMIKGGLPPGPVSPATFEDGVRSMHVLEAVRESARRGGELIEVM